MSRKYDVYGLGNALVDMTFEVIPSFLEKNGINKGTMTLIDEEAQQELINNLRGSQRTRSCGGSAANTLIAVSQFGGQSFYSCKVANDEMGDFYYQDLLEEGVENNLGSGRDEGTTGKCMVFITPDADRTMNTFLGITETISDKELNEQALANSEYLYLEGYLVTSELGRRAAVRAREMAKKHGVKTAITFSDPAMVSYFREGFDEMMGDGVDLLFCNETESLTYTGKDNIHDAAEELKKVAKSFAITLGPKGALIFDGKKEIAVVTKKVNAIDTNGAGDLFAGSFLYGITHGHSAIGAGRLACNAASVLVSQFGPRLNKEQASKIRDEIFD